VPEGCRRGAVIAPVTIRNSRPGTLRHGLG
jgi:hypothetical protein